MGMYCKKCRHDLRQAASGRCPECGLAFDPLLSETFRPRSNRKIDLPWRTIVTFAIVIGLGVTFERIVNASFMQPCSTPKFVSAVSQLQTIRSQLALYAHQHNEIFPTIDELNRNWTVLLNETDIEGNPVQAGELAYGPYLQKPPINALTGSSSVAAPGQSAATDGWEYDETSGMLWLVIPTQEEYNEQSAHPYDAVVPSWP